MVVKKSDSPTLNVTHKRLVQTPSKCILKGRTLSRSFLLTTSQMDLWNKSHGFLKRSIWSILIILFLQLSKNKAVMQMFSKYPSYKTLCVRQGIDWGVCSWSCFLFSNSGMFHLGSKSLQRPRLAATSLETSRTHFVSGHNIQHPSFLTPLCKDMTRQTNVNAAWVDGKWGVGGACCPDVTRQAAVN